MRPAPRLHYLSGNKAERSPRHVIYLDTETTWHAEGAGELHKLRVWCAEFTHRHSNQHRAGNSQWAEGKTRDELADTIDQWATHADSTWLYCHNTAFDLGVSRLPLELVARGWELGDHALTLNNPWCRLRKGRHSLTIADSVSILPAPLQTLGDRMGLRKPPLPDHGDSDAAWLVRCAADVTILRTAVTQLMDWWDRERLGCWSLTGPSTGWNAFRHKPSNYRVVIDPDPVARGWERNMIVGGRREVWWTGKVAASHFYEVDLKRAHLTACAEFPLPRKRIKGFTGEPPERYWTGGDRFAMAAEVTVTTDRPRYPVVIGRRVWHPVGTFRTLLAGPELHDARQRGDIVRVHRGVLYWLGYQMQPWARWLADVIDNTTGDVPPMAQVAGKGWSRTVPGKWATRTSRMIEQMPSHITGWALERGIHHPTNAPLTMLHFAGSQSWMVGDQEADDSFPAVLAWVQSYVRVALGRIVDRIGDERMVSCNTDGLICANLTEAELSQLHGWAEPFTPRVKAEYDRVEVITPAHILLDGRPRLSGIPRSATPAGDHRWSWHTWPKLGRQAELGHHDGYLRERRTVDLDSAPVARWVLDEGRAVPVTATVADDGSTQLAPYASTEWGRLGLRLRPVQHPQLRPLVPATQWSGPAALQPLTQPSADS